MNPGRIASVWRDLAAALLLALLGAQLPAAAYADGGHHSLWVVQGRYNTLTLVGSVHALPVTARELPEEAWQAYEHAKAVVLEVDLGSVDAARLAVLTRSLGLLPEDQTLEGVLGAGQYAKFVACVRRLGLEPALLEHAQPWLAALTLEQAGIARLGLDPASGVDQQFATRAVADHKPLIGLETLEEQLGLFAHLPLAEQRRYLEGTLDEQDRLADELDALIGAWRAGDAQTLERLMGKEFKDAPGLIATLTTERNRKWMRTLTPLLSEDGNYLVVVGALHLVGRDGLVDLLRRQGYAVVQH